jgi:heat shock protein HtpX
MLPKANLNPEARRSHELRNTLHTVIIVAGSALLVAAIAWTVFGLQGLFWAAGFAAFGIWSMGRVSPKMVLGLYKARALSPEELPELHDIVKKLAARAELPAVPHLYYVPSKMMNAFAVGRREDSAIAVTDGLVRAMTLRQLAGILAHETAHIRNGDLRVMGLADVFNRITSVISTLGWLGIPIIFGTNWQVPIYGLALMIAAPTIGGLLQLALSRTREYDADLDGAALTGDPEGLASALATLERKQRGLWEGLALPGGRVPEPSMLRTHPKTEDRIKRLMALREDTSAPVIRVEGHAHPGPSIIPTVRPPRVQWQRMGLWY